MLGIKRGKSKAIISVKNVQYFRLYIILVGIALTKLFELFIQFHNVNTDI